MVVCFLGGLVCLFRLVFFGMVCIRVSSESRSALFPTYWASGHQRPSRKAS